MAVSLYTHAQTHSNTDATGHWSLLPFKTSIYQVCQTELLIIPTWRRQQSRIQQIWNSQVNTKWATTSQTEYTAYKNPHRKHNKTEGNKQCAGATKLLPCPFPLIFSFVWSGFRVTAETANFSISADLYHLIRPQIQSTNTRIKVKFTMNKAKKDAAQLIKKNTNNN